MLTFKSLENSPKLVRKIARRRKIGWHSTCTNLSTSIFYEIGCLVPQIYKEQRIRDPIHGLIIFSAEGFWAHLDQTIWKLLNTPEMQRLRRIRQLGVTEMTFPGATHTRFAHSVGVFHTARLLARLIQKHTPDSQFDRSRAEVAVIAALVHDVGHGPFSHAFESAQKSRGVEKRHEKWTADIVRNPKGNIKPILDQFARGRDTAEEVATLLEAEDPTDEYHAIVSSSFDADRLDYLRRDRLMTGSGAGSIDFDWLIDNIDIAEVQMAADDDEDAPRIRTFCLKEKALQAAEAFLLARYHMFDQIYLHKATRGMEVIIHKIFDLISSSAIAGTENQYGLDQNDPFIRFFSSGGDKIENYLALDDFSAWSLIERLTRCGDEIAEGLAKRVRNRDLFKCIDINTRVPILPGETAEALAKRRQEEMARIEERVGNRINQTIFRDTESIGVYGEIGADVAKKHKKLSIKINDGTTREITQLSPVINALAGKRLVARYYCSDDSIKRLALGEQHDRA